VDNRNEYKNNDFQ